MAGMPIHPRLDWPKNISRVQKCLETGETTKFFEYGSTFFRGILKLEKDFDPSHICWEKIALKRQKNEKVKVKRQTFK